MDTFDHQLWEITPSEMGLDWRDMDLFGGLLDFPPQPDWEQLDVGEPASEGTIEGSTIDSVFQKTPIISDRMWENLCIDQTHPQNSVCGDGSRGCVLRESFQSHHPPLSPCPPKFQQSLLRNKQVSTPPSSQNHSLTCHFNDLQDTTDNYDGRLRPNLAGIDESSSQLPLRGSQSAMDGPLSPLSARGSGIDSGFQKTPIISNRMWANLCIDQTHPQNSVCGDGSRGCVLRGSFQPHHPPLSPCPAKFQQSLLRNKQVSNPPSSQNHSSRGPDLHDHPVRQQQPTPCRAELRETPRVLHRCFRQTSSGSHKPPYGDGEEDEKVEREATCSVASGDRDRMLSVHQATYAEDPSNARPPNNATLHEQHRPERHTTINSECCNDALTPPPSGCGCQRGAGCNSQDPSSAWKRNCLEQNRRIRMKELFEALRLEIPSIRHNGRKVSQKKILCEATALCKQLSQKDKVLRLKHKLLCNRVQYLESVIRGRKRKAKD